MITQGCNSRACTEAITTPLKPATCLLTVLETEALWSHRQHRVTFTVATLATLTGRTSWIIIFQWAERTGTEEGAWAMAQALGTLILMDIYLTSTGILDLALHHHLA